MPWPYQLAGIGLETWEKKVKDEWSSFAGYYWSLASVRLWNFFSGGPKKQVVVFCQKSKYATETLAETFESGPLCTTDLFQNKLVAYF